MYTADDIDNDEQDPDTKVEWYCGDAYGPRPWEPHHLGRVPQRGGCGRLQRGNPAISVSDEQATRHYCEECYEKGIEWWLRHTE